MTAGLVGVDLVDGDARGGEPWGSGVVCSCGVCTGGAMPACEDVGGWEERLGLPANAPFAAFGGRPRFRGLPSSARAVSDASSSQGCVRTVVAVLQVSVTVLGRATAL
jgi:hypothetical protein